MGSAAWGDSGVTGVSGGPNPSGDKGRGAFTGVRGGVAWPGQAWTREACAARSCVASIEHTAAASAQRAANLAAASPSLRLTRLQAGASR